MAVFDHIWRQSLQEPHAEVTRLMQLCLYDWAACALAGAAEPAAQAARALAGEGRVSLIGGGRTAVREAALINGTSGHALDYDDTHFGHIGHVSTVVWPTVLAMAQSGLRPGAGQVSVAMLSHFAAVGAEVAIRFGMWLGRSHYQTGFHQTATAGAFGALCALPPLLGWAGSLDRTKEQLGHALGLCATRASGLKSQFGTMGKPLNAGFAAATAVECALLANAGATSSVAALDGVQGFGPTHAGEADTTAWDFDPQAPEWRLLDTSFKFHACCHGLHAMLEALGTLDVTDAVQRVHVLTHPRWLSVCNQPEPTTGLEAKFSYRLTAAMALAGVPTAAMESFSDAICVRPDLVALRDCVTVTGDESLGETETRVQVETSAGTVEATHDLANRLPFDVLEPKLRQKAAALIGASRAEALWTATQTDTVDGLMAFLAQSSDRASISRSSA